MSFRIIRNDITKVTADAIVNTANPDPIYASGTDGAIYAAAGADELLAARKKIGTMEVGEAKATPAFMLDAKYIIHTVGPAWDGGVCGELDDLKKCYVNSLRLADELECESIAFPLISTGVYGFPKDKALQTATAAFGEFLSDHDMEITLVVFDPKSFELSGRIFAGVDEFIDNNYVSAQMDAEYGCEDANDVYDDMPSYRERRRLSIFNRQKADKDSAWDDAPVYDDSVSSPNPMAASPVFGAASCMMPAASCMMPAGSGRKKQKTLDDAIAHISDTWQESLLHIIDEKNLTDVEVYKRANVDRKLFSKIRGNKDYKPGKTTAIAFALALELNLDETKDMLARAGYALSPSSTFDLIIKYFIEQEYYNIIDINLALFDHDQPLI